MNYAEAIKALNDYFGGKDMKRGDALRIAELLSRAEKAEKIVDEYAESARAIALWLSGFCNKKLSYPSMISDAARKISTAYADIKEILGDNYDISRLRELAQADRDGKCEIFPCKVGDIAYVVNRGDYYSRYEPYISEKEIIEINWKKDRSGKDLGFGLILKGGNYNTSARYKLSSIGKTVFLTREEAEVALKERKKDE